MADIHHDLPINAEPAAVFRAVSDPEELAAWWTLTSRGEPADGAEYTLGFGPGYQWGGRVSRCTPGEEFELVITRADDDWTGTRVGFRLERMDEGTLVRFHHTGWPELNAHHRQSSYCWAMYLRRLKHWVERRETVTYECRTSD